ncbi:hypothetical protein FXO37_00304 [Capsicum annuum]|nr:hypothetical protein FXO37_00304 [Capsicum annuum]
MNRHLKKRKLRRFLLSSIDTVIIPRLHFDLAESDRYRDYPWGLVAYEELAKSLNKKLKPTRKFYMLHGMPLAIQIWLYECCSVVPRTITFKVDSEISRLLNWKTNVIRPRYESLMKSLFNDSNDKSPEMSFFNREDEDDVLSKKVFEKFRDEVRKEFNDIRNLVSTTSDQLMNSINEMKKQEKDKDCDKAQMEEDNKNTSPHQSTSTAVEGFNKNSEGILVKDYEFVKPQLDEANKDTSPHESTPILHHDFDKNPEGTLVIEEIKEKQSTNFTELYNADNDVVLDKIDTSVHEERDVCDSTNTEAAAEIIENISMADCEKSNLNEQINSEVHTHEAVFGEGKSQPDLRDFQVTIPDELLPSLNEYVNLERSIIVHPFANKEQTPVNVSRTKRPSKFKESPFTTKFGSAEDFRCIYVYDSLSSVGYDFVVLAEVEKLAEVIPYYLLVCKFYEKKGIDNDNHPNYKLNDKHDLFDVYIMEDLTPQPCDSLDCGLYMITYAECFTFDGSVSKVDFDPDLFCTRYTSMLWHYGTRK